MADKGRVAAIIVAAGSGKRMGTATKKQYALLGDLPVLAHTLYAFDNCDAIDEVFLVIPKDDHDICLQQILAPLKTFKPVHMIIGGSSRQESVYKGLKATQKRFQFVAIHDGVRPLVRPEKIAACIKEAKRYGACILGVLATDTVKTIDEKSCVVSTVTRNMVRMAQTPQAFCYEDILRAHVSARKDNYIATDDAELVEMCGGMVKVIEGDPDNIKITNRTDLRIARVLLEQGTAGQDIDGVQR